MAFLAWIALVLGAAFNRSIDTTQVLLFVAIVLAELATIWAPAWLKPAMLEVSRKISSGRVALIFLIGVVVTRLLLAPYWVWEDEHKARTEAEAQLRASPTVDNTWPLTIDEKNRLAPILEANDWKQFKITIMCNDNAAVYANRLSNFFKDHGWDAYPGCNFLIRSTSTGMWIGLSPDTFSGKKDIPSQAATLMSFFDDAKIHYQKAGIDEVKDGSFSLVIGLPQ